MPEPPDFDQIADKMVHAGVCTSDEIAEQLRQVWNARGAADLATLNARGAADLATLNADRMPGPYCDALERALRSLDR